MERVELRLITVEPEAGEIPWLKIFVRRKVREFSACTPEEKAAVWTALDRIERDMLAYYRPEKINIASFGNIVPQVHWHIMARFREDSRFPEPMWAEKKRESALNLPPFEPFYDAVRAKLSSLLG